MWYPSRRPNRSAWTKLLLALRDNQLAVWSREAFVGDFGEGRLLFSNFVLVNEPELIEHVLATNHRNYVKGRLTRRILQPGFPRWRSHRTRSALARLDRTIYGFIAARRAAQALPVDLLSLLLAARDEETGEAMTDTQLRDEVLTFFAAGHETTALALTWTLYLLSRHPDIERTLHDEVDRVPGDGETTFADVEALSYTRMVIEEAMRLFPPVYSLSRTALADDEVGGHRIRAGSVVNISPYVTHRNPRLWRDPLRFDPERFTPDRVKERHRYAYLPFGGGPRICVGRGFAMAEACLVLATIARAYRLRVAPGHRVEAHGRITLRPRHGLRMTLERR